MRRLLGFKHRLLGLVTTAGVMALVVILLGYKH